MKLSKSLAALLLLVGLTGAALFSEEIRKTEGLYKQYEFQQQVDLMLAHYKMADTECSIISGYFTLPVANAEIISGFGQRINPATNKKGAFHWGVDLSGNVGDPVLAALPGTIVSCSYNRWHGLHIVIRHSQKCFTKYFHLSDCIAKEGHPVARGQQIGEVGKSGQTVRPHLHFEVKPTAREQ